MNFEKKCFAVMVVLVILGCVHLFNKKITSSPTPLSNKVQQEQVGKISPPKVSFKQKEIDCLAKNIYYEAAHEPVEGKKAVAFVTLNRVKHKAFPNTVCGVVYQKTVLKNTGKKVCQFSWTCGVKKKHNRKEYQSAVKIAHTVYNNRKHYRDNTYGSTHFHAGHIVWPEWSNSLQYTTAIGQHVFYKFPKKNQEG